MQWLSALGAISLYFTGLLILICLHIAIRVYARGLGSDQSRSVFILYTALNGVVGLFWALWTGVQLFVNPDVTVTGSLLMGALLVLIGLPLGLIRARPIGRKRTTPYRQPLRTYLIMSRLLFAWTVPPALMVALSPIWQ